MTFYQVGTEIINFETITHVEIDALYKSKPYVVIYFVGRDDLTITGNPDVDRFMDCMKNYAFLQEKSLKDEIPKEVLESMKSVKENFATPDSLKRLLGDAEI